MEAAVLIVYSFPIPLSDNHSIHKLALEKTSCHHHHGHQFDHDPQFYHHYLGFVEMFERDGILSELRKILFSGEIAREEVCGTIDLRLHHEKFIAI